MPDYKKMLQDQGKSPLSYPDTTPKGAPKRDYSDSPLRKNMTYEEPMPHEDPQDYHYLVAKASEGFALMLTELPDCKHKQNAIHYFETCILWAHQAAETAEK